MSSFIVVVVAVVVAAVVGVVVADVDAYFHHWYLHSA